MFLHLASIRRWYLAEHRVRSDNAVKHFEDKDNKRLIPATVRNKSLGCEKTVRPSND